MPAFTYSELPGPVGLITFDLPDQKVNTLGRVVLAELAEVLAPLEARTDLQGLLFKSGKAGQFIAGADLKELAALVDMTREQMAPALEAGHALFSRFSQLPYPTVALIDGACMGGGTELVLSLDGRIASRNPVTKIALPEVKIGLFPAWGGTQRLPRLIGIHHAIDIICGGEPVSAERAAQLGLVFDAVPADKLIEEGVRLLAHLRESGRWKEVRRRASQPLGLTEDQMNFAFAVAEGHVRGQTKGQYPAPLAALRAMREGINQPLEEGLRIEREIALEIVGTPISGNLIGVFFLNNRAARDTGIENSAIQPRPIQKAGVLGAGLMGAGIATAHARRGIPAVMVDVSDDRLADGVRRARDVVESRIKIGRAQPKDLADLLTQLSTSVSTQRFSECDIVIEAVTENEQLKTKMYGEMAPHLKPDAILASNTSTISITRMAAAAPHPERFLGMHFFYPIDRMQLVEVIRGEKTDDETVATVVALAKRIGKTPIVMQDCAGFLVNRILLPYMNEAVIMLLEGAGMDDLDRVATKFGMPMGPIALHDLVGLDTALYAGQVLVGAYGDRAVQPPLLEALVAAKRLGKKTGSGFRKFGGKKGLPQTDPALEPILAPLRTGQRTFSDEEITDRLFLPMLLEATRVLEEGIVKEPGQVDLGLILGIGFPPFRGGILRWCDNVGAAKIVATLEKYRSLGKRFEPTQLLLDHAQHGTRFYPRSAS